MHYRFWHDPKKEKAILQFPTQATHKPGVWRTVQLETQDQSNFTKHSLILEKKRT